MLRVIVCPDCWKVTRHVDPNQGELFARASYGKRRSLAAVIAGHFTHRRPRDFDTDTHAELLTTEAAKHPEPAHNWPRRASLAERRKYPFH